MPSKYSLKQFVENGYYHLYNRGVEKRNIFMDDQDYAVFLSYIKRYLDPEGTDPYPLNKSLADKVDLLAYCLMPNHFHFMAKQKTKDGITRFMRAICTNYSMYFNKKYNREGTLFQGRYKGVLVDNDTYLLHLSRYIHLNPLKLGSVPKDYAYSSYNHYLKLKNAKWLKTDEVLSFYKTARKSSLRDYFSYESFIEDYIIDSSEILGGLTLENRDGP